MEPTVENPPDSEQAKQGALFQNAKTVISTNEELDAYLLTVEDALRKRICELDAELVRLRYDLWMMSQISNKIGI